MTTVGTFEHIKVSMGLLGYLVHGICYVIVYGTYQLRG